MDLIWKVVIWNQFGAAIDMLDDALKACPEALWTKRMWNDPNIPASSEFWYVAYHTLFWLDLYLSGAVDGFTPPPPFNLDEVDMSGVLPERVYTCEELHSYQAHCREKCRQTLETLTDDQAHRLCYFTWRKDGLTFAELLLDNMRHVQEHGAQLHMFLGQQAGIQSRWVNKAAEI